MEEQPRWQREAWFPLVAGLAWMWAGMSAGVVGFLLALVPGVLLLASGASKLLWPGDRRIPQFAAIGGALGVLIALPGIVLFGFGSALLLGGLSAAGFVSAGFSALRREPAVEGVPVPQIGVGLAAKVAVDEALLATMTATMPMPRGDVAHMVHNEVEAARELYAARGWLEKPESFHMTPMPLDAPQIRNRTVRLRGGVTPYEYLSFESEYEPHPDEPGRERWLDYATNRMAHACVLRHDDGPRPWLVCIHGYQMGSPLIDLGAFDPRLYHEKLGLNLLLPVLPLHGTRKMGRRSGDGFLSANTLDSVHAEAQAMWDIRRLLTWVRAQDPTAVGVYGLSLGGYNAALLASLDADLACAIPGIPATDFARLFWRHGPMLQLEYMESRGMLNEHVAEVLQVVSPLELKPKVAHENRAIFGGVADRLVPPDQVRDLWEHWDRPELVWYQGAHLSFMNEPAVGSLVENTLRRTLLPESKSAAA